MVINCAQISWYAYRGAYQSLPGLGWGDLSDDRNGMPAVFLIFFVETIVFLLAAWYFEQVSRAAGLQSILQQTCGGSTSSCGTSPPTLFGSFSILCVLSPLTHPLCYGAVRC